MVLKTDHRGDQAEKPKLTIDTAHYGRLLTFARSAAERIPDIGERLLEEIERADIVDSDKMPPDVVTIGSQVTYEDSATGRTQHMQLVLPQQADLQKKRLSLLTPVGAALIGLSAGHSIHWEMSDGTTRVIKVIEVTPGEVEE